MDMVKICRLILALVFAGIAAGCLYAYAVAPYEMVTTTTTTTRAVPGWEGLFLAAICSGVAALVTAVSGDWD